MTLLDLLRFAGLRKFVVDGTTLTWQAVVGHENQADASEPLDDVTTARRGQALIRACARARKRLVRTTT